MTRVVQLPKPRNLVFAAALFSASACLAAPLELRVKGTQILNRHGQSVRLRGVNAACLEWTSDGEGRILNTVKVAIDDWKANIIRLPMSEDRWFGKGPEQKDGGMAYRALVRSVVDLIASKSAYVLLDLHWNDGDEWGKNIGQHQMPDMNSVAFWKECAREYRNNPAVLFDLYNEPHNISWDLWKNGGTVTEKTGPGARQGRFVPITYQAPGMQLLLDTVRSTGAKNMVVAGGLDWAYDLSGFLNGYKLTDKRGRGVIYACHAYPNKGESIDKFLAKFDAALPTVPIIVSEFGSQNRPPNADQPNVWVARLISEIEKRKCNWIAWDMHPAAGPCLITGWTYEPTPSFGSIVKRALAN